MAEGSSKKTKLIVAAMDFGTTYSGYAYSFRDKPKKIYANPGWTAASDTLISLKSPTCILLTPNKEFHSFGFAAEDKYSDLAEENEHHDWYLFRRFKMILYETKYLQLDTPVEDILGKKMPAIDIFSHAIWYLKNHLWTTIQSRALGFIETDIQYIITVPAIWDERAKQFMRRAATKAKIPNDQIAFALEPEAASVWCQAETDDKLSYISEPLTKYMVIDLGGGTADITVHQKMDDESLKELHKASGGAWGGNEVDKAYLRMLSDIVGAEAIEKFKQQEMMDYIDILRNFETKKRAITTNTDGKVTFKVPPSLRSLGGLGDLKKHGKVENTHSLRKFTLTGDKLRIEKSAAKALFDTPITMLISHIGKMFADPIIQDVDVVLLVGGFGECELVKEAFEKHFPNKRLMIPPEVGLAVLKGAVLFGQFQDIVKTRIARFTIGHEVWPRFEDHHDPSKKKIVDGVERCKDIFRKMIEIGEEVPKYKTIVEESNALYGSQESCCIRIFSSTEAHVKYTTEPKCQELGRLVFVFPDSQQRSDKKHIIRYFFGDTEIHIHVKMLKTGEEHEMWIDCFSS